MSGRDLSGFDLSNANLSNADLSFADLSNANLTNAILTADLTRVRSGGIVGVPAALPSFYQIINGYLVGPVADLTNANLTNANLSGADLLSADLTGANLSGADLISASLDNANLTNAILTSANLTNANLEGANLAETDLRFAVLTSANLTGVDLTNANLSGVSSGGIVGVPAALPSGYQIINGYLVGPAPPAPESEHMILFRMERNGERRERMIRISEVDAYRRDAEANNWTYQIINGYLVGPGATPAPESEQPIIFRVRMQDGRVQRIRTTPSQVERDQARARERGWEIVQ